MRNFSKHTHTRPVSTLRLTILTHPSGSHLYTLQGFPRSFWPSPIPPYPHWDPLSASSPVPSITRKKRIWVTYLNSLLTHLNGLNGINMQQYTLDWDQKCLLGVIYLNFTWVSPFGNSFSIIYYITQHALHEPFTKFDIWQEMVGLGAGVSGTPSALPGGANDAWHQIGLPGTPPARFPIWKNGWHSSVHSSWTFTLCLPVCDVLSHLSWSNPRE